MTFWKRSGPIFVGVELKRAARVWLRGRHAWKTPESPDEGSDDEKLLDCPGPFPVSRKYSEQIG